MLAKALALAAGGGFTVTHVASSARYGTSGAAYVTMPVEQRSGDIVVWAGFGQQGLSSPTAAAPTGYTLVTNASANNGTAYWTIAMGYKLTDSDDGGDNITSMTVGGFLISILSVYRPTRTVASIGATTGGSAQITSGDPTAHSLALGSGSKPVIAAALYTTIDPVGTFTDTFTLAGVEPANRVDSSAAHPTNDETTAQLSTVAANYPTATYVVDLNNTFTVSGLASMWLELTEA